MKALVRTKHWKDYSSLSVQDIPKPELKKDDVRVKMCASRINAVDIEIMKYFPHDLIKDNLVGGVDGSGTIIEVGENVHDLDPGDEVFFYLKFKKIGSWAEEVVVKSNKVAIVPENVSLEEAGSMAFPLLLAYDALKKIPRRFVERILIHGAGGTVGFYAAQIAQSMGLQVFAVAESPFHLLLKKIGVTQIFSKKDDLLMIFRKNAPDTIFNPFGKKTSIKTIFQGKTVGTPTLPTHPTVSKYVTKYTFRSVAKKANKVSVDLTGIGTDANTDAQILQKASDHVSEMNYQVHPYETITLEEIEQKGLSEDDVNKVILFNTTNTST